MASKLHKEDYRKLNENELQNKPQKSYRLKNDGNKSLGGLLAHLSRRLIGELIGYPWSGVRPSITVVDNAKISVFLRNHRANQSQIVCGASLDRWNENLLMASGSHDQTGRHTHVW